MIGNLIIASGLSVALMACLDILLTDHQKELLSKSSVSLWDKIDNVKKLSFVPWIRRASASWLGTATVAAILAQFVKDPDSKLRSFPFQLPAMKILGIVVIGSALSYLLMLFICKATTIFGFLARAAIGLAIIVFLLLVGDQFDLFPESAILLKGNAFIIFGLLCFLFVNWLFIVAPIAIAAVAAGLLTIFEFVVRRVSEHPKGPIFALSALLAALGAAAKAFSG